MVAAVCWYTHWVVLHRWWLCKSHPKKFMWYIMNYTLSENKIFLKKLSQGRGPCIYSLVYLLMNFAKRVLTVISKFHLWWHISATTCQIIMLNCQILMPFCQIFMLTCQKKIIITSSLISCIYSVLMPLTAIYMTIWYLTSRQVDKVIWQVDIIFWQVGLMIGQVGRIT